MQTTGDTAPSRCYALDSATAIVAVYLVVYHGFSVHWDLYMWFRAVAPFEAASMAWFFMKGGYLHKVRPRGSELMRIRRQLLLPWAFFFALSWCVWVCTEWRTECACSPRSFFVPIRMFLEKGEFYWAPTIWFLWTYMLVKLARVGGRRATLCAAALSLALLLFYAVTGLPKYPLFALNFLPALLCYLVGERERRCSPKGGFFTPSRSRLVAVAAVAAVAATAACYPFILNFREMDCFGYNPLVTIPFAAAAVWTLNRVAYAFLDRPGVLAYIGRHGMGIYLLHVPVIRVMIALQPDICTLPTPLLTLFSLLVAAASLGLTIALKRAGLGAIIGEIPAPRHATTQSVNPLPTQPSDAI